MAHDIFDTFATHASLVSHVSDRLSGIKMVLVMALMGMFLLF